MKRCIKAGSYPRVLSSIHHSAFCIPRSAFNSSASFLLFVHWPKRLNRDLAGFELPLFAYLSVLIIIPSRHQALLAVPHESHFDITPSCSAVRSHQFDDMIMNEGPWPHRVQPLTDHLA